MIAIVLPSFNEEGSLPILISHIRHLAEKRLLEGIRILVIDDGSSDGTYRCVEELAGNDLILVRHDVNKGLGEALKTGILEALKLSPDIDVIVTMDSDNTHSPGLLMRMIMALDEGNDVVIASRYRPGSRVVGLSWFRRLLSLGMSWMFRILFPIKGVRDYSCGYRAYKAELLQQAFDKWGDQFISQSGFSCMVDILLKLNRLNVIFSEVPLILRYDLKHGKSKMNVQKTIRETINLAVREKVSSIKSNHHL